MAWLDDWAHRLELTIDHDRVDEDLTDFPVLITLSSGVGRNDFDATCVFDELTAVSGIVFSDYFSSGGSQWYDVAGVADYSSEYLEHNSDGERARTINNINLGKYWEMTFKFKQHGGGGNNDQLRVNPVYSAAGGVDIQIYMRTYNSSSYSLEFFVEGASKGTVSTYNWYNERGNWISVRLKREGNNIYFRVWVPPDPEPAGWSKTSTCTGAFAEEAQFDFQTTYTDSNGTGLDDIVVRAGISNNKKIAITDYTGINKLYTEIEYWSINTKKATLWTNVPTIASGTDTTIYLYYDKDQLDNDVYVGDTGTSAAQKVWEDTGYDIVYHMNQDPTAAQVKSSTGSNHAVPHSFSTSSLQNGLTGQSYFFPGDPENDYLELTFNFGNIYTIEVFAYNDFDTSAYPQILGREKYIGWSMRPDEGQGFYLGNGGSWDTGWKFSDTYPPSDEWFYASIRNNASAISYRLNEDDDGGGTYVTRSINTQIHVGRRNDSTSTEYNFDGKIQEFRLAKEIKSDAWLRATNYTLFDSLFSYSHGTRPVFTASGTVTVDNMLTDDIPVRLYRRSTGELVGSTATTSGGHFEVDTHYDEDHYILALYTTSGTNAVIYDWIAP